jgi:DNA-binding NarL/FixJ family response regulator
MPGFRAVLVSVPPLLADLTRHVMTGRVGLSIIAEIADPETAANCLRDLAPDVVIIGPAANARTLNAALVRLMLPRAKVLALSADFTQLFGPGEDDVTVFTPDTLADCLRQEDRDPGI